MIKGNYHLAKVRPNIDVTGATAYTQHDVLFDWHRFEIPRGACAIKSFNMIVAGTEGAAVAGLDMEIFFATSVNGVAPTTIAAANVDSQVKATWTACRNNIIGHKILDASAMENSDTYTLSYNLWDQTAAGDQVQNQINIVLEGDPSYLGATAGYQSIWMCAVSLAGGEDFNTGVLIDGDQAITTTTTALVTTGTDADDVFAVGDEIMAFDEDGSGPAVVGTVTAVAANLLTVDKVAAAIGDEDELCFRGPFQFNLGLEY